MQIAADASAMKREAKEICKGRGATIRPATLGDGQAIFELIRSNPNELIVRPLADIVQQIDRFIVACSEDGVIVGCASWGVLPDIGKAMKASIEIKSVAIKEAWRRQGIGRALVNAVMERIKPLAAPQILVLTFTPPFFAEMGFVEIPKSSIMHKIYSGCMGCTKHADPFTCPEVAMEWRPNAAN